MSGSRQEQSEFSMSITTKELKLMEFCCTEFHVVFRNEATPI